MKSKLLILAVALSAGPAFADGGGQSAIATTQGTLHPGHVAVFATGKGDPEAGRYNRPAADFHLDGTPYSTGAGGYATTKRNGNANR
jgi:hypothetical protein